MTLKAKLTAEEFSALPETVQEHYGETEDGYLLAVNSVDGWALEDVNGLKTALASERAEKGKLKDKMKLFSDLDPVEAKAALSKVAEMQNWTPEDKVAEQLKAREEQLVKKHSAAVEELSGERDSLRAQLEEQLVDNAAMLALTKHEGSVELLLPHVRSQTKIERDSNGKFVARIVDGNGNPRITTKSGSTEPMGIDEFVETLKTNDTFKPAFNGSGARGTGSAGGQRGAGSEGSHIITSSDARDPQKYRAAKAAAEKAGTQLQIAE